MSPEVTCSECGTLQRPGDSCRDRYHRCLAREFAEPAYFTVHHLTVAAYQLQHPSLMPAADWQATRRLLGRFLHDDTLPSQVRAEVGRSTPRVGRASAKDRVALPAGFVWTSAIPHVAGEPPDAYTAAIAAWAAAVLAESERLAQA